MNRKTGIIGIALSLVMAFAPLTYAQEEPRFYLMRFNEMFEDTVFKVQLIFVTDEHARAELLKNYYDKVKEREDFWLKVNQEKNAPPGELKQFKSYGELQRFLKDRTNYYYDKVDANTQRLGIATQTAMEAASAEGGGQEFSLTNVQVAGVDEPDIAKTDGTYIYTVTGGKVYISKAYPPEDASILSELLPAENEYIRDIFVNNDKLVVFSQSFGYRIYDKTVLQPAEGRASDSRIAASPTIVDYGTPQSYIKVYDIHDRENPTLAREITASGDYFDARMIGDYVYAVVNMPLYPYTSPSSVPLPVVDGEETPANAIYYFDIPDYSYNYVTVLSLNTQNDAEQHNSKTFLTGYSQDMYVSAGNMYVTYANMMEQQEKTLVHKIALSNGAIEYRNYGTVPGTVLNQFSMDEHNVYFRIATTTNSFSEPSNNVYVLDSSMKLVGKLENMAPGERIFSVRFLGDRAYLVTFVRIDPLFVIDLNDPARPALLGELKVPGVSDYLHPYDENHLIGVGRATEEHDGFVTFSGLKLSLFDVSDVSNPKELSSYEVKDGYSEAINDHKAFLFSREKNLLVLPVSVYSAESFWQGAYAFGLSLDNGFDLKGKITHADDSADYWMQPSIRRSLYIDNVLYTVSDRMIQMHNLGTMEKLNAVAFLQPEPLPEPITVPAPLPSEPIEGGVEKPTQPPAAPRPPENTFCIQVIQPARNPETGECKEFPTPCDVPEDWEPVDSCNGPAM
ncbi:MAG: beta-propeller domain-containing protein [Candidatus Aenigmarchaeota archaeon]|nr:beta-propeller domain-containing protein [Candidatus Aenigmarchaeota archaeon]